MKNKYKKIIFIVVSIIIIIIAITAILFFNELKTLSSLKKIDDYPFYTMTYSGDYGFEEFLTVGAESDRDIEKFVANRLLKGLDIDLGITSGGCTAFTVKSDNGHQIYGRNFDFAHSLPLILHTKPDDGYASVSFVDLSYAGYSNEYLPQQYRLSSFTALIAPYLPFDGMNERGVTIALMAVPYTEPPQKEDQITLNTTTAIRLVLDYAASVDEAVELLKQYNFYFSGDIDCHYLIADTTGQSVIVEFLEEELKVVKSNTNYQVASNFIAYNGLNIGEGYNEFIRYDIIDEYLTAQNGVITEDEAMSLLSKAKTSGRTQWSAVYNMDMKTVKVCIDEDYEEVYEFDFDGK